MKGLLLGAVLAAVLVSAPAKAQQVVSPCTKSGVSCYPASTATPLPIITATPPTYFYSTSVAIAAAPTDVVLDCGSASKTVTVQSVELQGFASSGGGTLAVKLIRRAPDTGGTSSALTGTVHDTNDAPATASVLTYTANPTLGAPVGDVLDTLLLFGLTGSNNQYIPFVFSPRAQAIVLRGANDCLAVDLLGQSTPAGPTVYVNIIQTEQ